MKKRIDVIVVGELNVDLILNRIEGLPEVGKEKLAEQMTLTVGSSSAIFASNLSALGASVAFLGKIGQDVFGDLVIESLVKKGVDTDMVIRDPNLKTGTTIVLNYDEDRAMVTYPGGMNHLTIDDITVEKLTKAKHLHFSSYFLQSGIRNEVGTMFKMAKEIGLTTSLDPQWDPEEQWALDHEKILPYVDVFIPNKQELICLTGQSNLCKAISYFGEFANLVVTKMGDAGSYALIEGREVKAAPFLNKKVVDAIGAGDSFDAGFIYKYIQNKPIEACMKFGNLTGAINTTAAGGTMAFANYDAIMQIAEERFGYQA